MSTATRTMVKKIKTVDKNARIVTNGRCKTAGGCSATTRVVAVAAVITRLWLDLGLTFAPLPGNISNRDRHGYGGATRRNKGQGQGKEKRATRNPASRTRQAAGSRREDPPVCHEIYSETRRRRRHPPSQGGRCRPRVLASPHNRRQSTHHDCMFCVVVVYFRILIRLIYSHKLGVVFEFRVKGRVSSFRQLGGAVLVPRRLRASPCRELGLLSRCARFGMRPLEQLQVWRRERPECCALQRASPISDLVISTFRFCPHTSSICLFFFRGPYSRVFMVRAHCACMLYVMAGGWVGCVCVPNFTTTIYWIRRVTP